MKITTYDIIKYGKKEKPHQGVVVESSLSFDKAKINLTKHRNQDIINNYAMKLKE